MAAADTVPPPPGGQFTVERADAEAYQQPGPVLTAEQLKRFERGRKRFEARWVVFPFPSGEWGLGPTFIAERCTDCHVGAGRLGPPMAADVQPQATLVRLSLPGTDVHGGPKPHPNYGDQLQNRGLTGDDPQAHGYGDRVQPEADVYIDWQEQKVELSEGETITLRSPTIRIENLRFGPLGDDVLLSLRNTQPMFGLGLLEAVPESSLLALAAEQQKLGYRGHPNYAWDAIEQREALGRFGWKANVPTLRQQLAAASIGDIGVTTSLFPEENCPPVQTDCLAQPPGNKPELLDTDLSNMELFNLALAVPARRNAGDSEVQRGERLFRQAQCAVCHVAPLTTGPHPVLPQLEGQTIYPYTDLLLHDMGDGLSDGRPDFRAGPRDWRTAPLWGLGLAETVNGRLSLLHDGRARSVKEAILWHGGEAQASRDGFVDMPKTDRDALVEFVLSL